jgi:predicted transglutaminase-like cysteine proteinase
MSVFVKVLQVIVLVATICGASTFADERSSALSLAGEADSGDTAGAQVAIKNTSDQVAFENKWDDRASPLLAPITASLPSRDQEPTTVDPAPIWSWAATAMLSTTSAKWADLQSRIRADKATLAACRSGDGPCPAAARRFLSVIEQGRKRQGRALLGEINRAINLSIRPMSDLAQYGVEDYWASPLESLSSGAGDCEDYAIAKYVALEESGVAPDALQLEIVRDVEHQATHAVVEVRYKDEWLILDNRTLRIVNADETHYYPLLALDHQGVRTFATEVSRRRAIQAGVFVSNLQDDRITTVSSNLAMTNRLQKVD